MASPNRPPQVEDTLLLESVLELLPTGVVVYDGDRRVRLINSAGRCLFGLPAGDPLCGISHDQLAERLLPRFADLATARLSLQPPTTPSTAYQELALINPDQRLVALRTCACDPQGIPLVGVIVLQDVTATLRDEQSRQERMAVVAHELKTPLTNIKAYTQLAIMRLQAAACSHQDDPALAIVQQSIGHLQTVIEQANRLAQLIVELIETSRPPDGSSRSTVAPGMAAPPASPGASL